MHVRICEHNLELGRLQRGKEIEICIRGRGVRMPAPTEGFQPDVCGAGWWDMDVAVGKVKNRISRKSPDEWEKGESSLLQLLLCMAGCVCSREEPMS